MKHIKIIFTSFVIKEMCLCNPWKSPMEPWGSVERSLSTSALVQNTCSDLETNIRRLVLLNSCWYICKRNVVRYAWHRAFVFLSRVR